MTGLQNLTGLIIDDDDDSRGMCVKVLETAGVQVFQANNVEEGLGVAYKEVPHFILLDLRLPGKSGFDFLEEALKSKKLKRIPKIIFSNIKNKKSITHAMKLGAVDYSVKPFSSQILVRKIRKAIKKTNFLSVRLEFEHQYTLTARVEGIVLKGNPGFLTLATPCKFRKGELPKIEGGIFDSKEVVGTVPVVLDDSKWLGETSMYLSQVSIAGINSSNWRKLKEKLEGMN